MIFPRIERGQREERSRDRVRTVCLRILASSTLNCLLISLLTNLCGMVIFRILCVTEKWNFHVKININNTYLDNLDSPTRPSPLSAMITEAWVPVTQVSYRVASRCWGDGESY